MISMTSKRIYTVLMALIAVVAVSAQTLFNSLTMENGLSGKSVFSIYKDVHGFYWFGTSNGATMYNGASTRKFMTGDNSSGVIVYSIAEDAKGVVLGTSDGFYRPDFGTGSLKRVYSDIDMCVNSIIRYDNGLLAGTEKGLYRLGGKASDKDFSLELFGVDEDTEVNDICADGRDLYIVTPNDLLIYSGKTRRGKRIDIARRCSLIGSLRCLAKSGRFIYLGTSSEGLLKYDIIADSVYRLMDVGSNVIMSVEADSNGNIYVGTDGGGAHVISVYDDRISKSYTTQTEPMMEDNSVYCFHHDSDNDVDFLGFYKIGVIHSYADKGVFSTYSFKDFTTAGIKVRSFCINGKEKVIGTRNGLYYVDEGRDMVKYFSKQEVGGSIILFICRYAGKYYISTFDGGFSVFDPATLTFSRVAEVPELKHAQCNNIAISPNGNLWVCTDVGIFVLDENEHLVRSFTNANAGFMDGYVTSLVFFGGENVWVGSSMGLSVYDPGKKKFRHVDLPKGLYEKGRDLMLFSSQTSKSVFAYSSSMLIESNGSEKEFSQINLDNLFTNEMCFVREDSAGNYWLASDNGLFVFDKQWKDFIHFTYADGVHSNLFYSNSSFFVDSQNYVWIGCSDGLIYADTRDVQKKVVGTGTKHIIPNSVAVGGRLLEYDELMDIIETKRIELSWAFGSEDLSINPLMLDYSRVSDHIFEYKIDDEEEWHPVRYDDLMNISGLWMGEHVLHIRTSEMNSVCTDYVIVVYPDIYMILGILALIVIGYFLSVYIRKYMEIKMRRNYLETERKRIQRELAEALRAEAAKLKYDNESLNSRIELLTAEKEAKDKYKGSRLEQKDYEKIFYSLCRYLQHEKPYLNPDLKISEVAKAIGSTSANMSQFFTLYLNRSYHEFINSYRLEEFKSRIQDPKYKNYTITAVSEMCGFRKSSFFTTFKSQEGCTPSEYMERIGIKAGVQNGADEDPEKLPDADAEKPDDGRNDGE